MDSYNEEAEINFSVGRRFLTGNGVDKDITKAKDLLGQAAAMGHSLALQLLDSIAEVVVSDQEKRDNDPLTDMLHPLKSISQQKIRLTVVPLYCVQVEHSECCHGHQMWKKWRDFSMKMV